MNLVILIGLGLIGLAHALRGLARIGRGAAPIRVAGRRMVLPLAGVALSIVGLLIGWSAGLPMPIGYAGGEGGLGLDPVGCAFCSLLFATATWFDAADPTTDADAGQRDLRVAAIALAVLSGDAFLLATGACLALLLPGRLSGLHGLWRSVLAAFAVMGACALLCGLVAPAGGLVVDPGFVLLRAGGGVATLLLPVLVLLAIMPLLGLWPMTDGFRHRCAFAPVWVPATGVILGQFLLLRFMLDLAGPAGSPRSGILLVLLGMGSAIRAGVAGLAESRASAVIGCVLAAQNGLVVVAVGLCLLAGSNDLPVLAGSARDAVFLLAPASVLGGVSCLSLMRAMEREAGSGLLSRLGGLVRSMPRASLVMLVPMALLGGMPPFTGFVVLWLLLQIVLAPPLPMVAGVAVPTLLLLVSLAGAAGLSATCLLRVGLVAMLGRPRTPRGAAATDLDRMVLGRHLLLLTPPILAGLVPGAWLRLAATRGDDASEGGRHALFWLEAPAGNAVLSPLPVLILLATAVVATVLFARGLGARPEQRQRGWEDGAQPPPPWLPFGDPATQIAPATMILTLRQALALSWPGGVLDALHVGRFGAGGRGEVIRQIRRRSVMLRSILVRHGIVLASGVLALALGAVAGGIPFGGSGP